ncbi:MAG: SLC13 family permease [Bacteroidota bacterium]
MLIFYLLLSIAIIIFLSARLQVHPFVALLIVAIFYGIAAGIPLNQLITSVNKGFGNTLGGIGLIIILGVIIGAFLENSGGAFALAERVLKFAGKKRIPLAMSLIGWVVSIPVFADSGFMLLASLNKSLSKKAGLSLSVTGVALAIGLTASHTLVPPTPGPIAAAHYLNANLGLVILLGIPLSLMALLVALFFVKKYASRVYVDPDPQSGAINIHEQANLAPGAFRSSLPIFVPIILIVTKSILISFSGFQSNNFDSFPALIKLLFFLGEPFVALIIGCLFAFLLPQKLNRGMFTTTGWIGKALTDAASILLITGAGGVFGQVLRDSGIATILGDTLSGLHMGILLPFLLAASIKTAQGSSTVALITTASILAPLMMELGFETELQKASVVLAIGAGSAVVSHANDSFFWVATGLSGLNVQNGYRFLSFGTLILGTAAISILSLLQLILSFFTA